MSSFELNSNEIWILNHHNVFQLATILTAAAKLKQVAEQAMRKFFSSDEHWDGNVGEDLDYLFTKQDQEICVSEGSPSEPASSEGGGRKLAFHEPRPCPTCQVTIFCCLSVGCQHVRCHQTKPYSVTHFFPIVNIVTVNDY